MIQDKWRVLIAMCMFTVLLNFDFTGINLAISVMAHELHAKLTMMQWVMVSYVLAAGMFTILGGKLGDKYGHRNLFVYGTLLYIIGSIMACIAHHMPLLIGGRFIQGMAIGLAYPMTIILTMNAFPKKQHGKAIGIIVSTMGISMAIGPSLGGLFIHYANWRWIFYINVPLGIITILLSLCSCKKDMAIRPDSIDSFGCFLSMLVMFLLTLSANEIQNWGLTSSYFICSIIASMFCIYLLFVWTKKKQNPFIPIDLLTHKLFAIHTFIRIISQICLMIIFFFTPIYMQNILGFSVLKTSLALLSLTVVIGIASPLAGIWTDRAGPTPPTSTGMVFFVLSGIFAYSALHTLFIPLISVSYLFCGIAIGLVFTSTSKGAFMSINEKRLGVANGIYFSLCWLANALGLAVSGAILAFSARHALQSFLHTHSFLLKSFSLITLDRFVSGMQPLNNLSPALKTTFAYFFSQGLANTFIFMMVLSLIGLLASLALHSKK